MIREEPKSILLKLMSDEIEIIIAELSQAPHNVYKFMNYNTIIDKLNKSLGNE